MLEHEPEAGESADLERKEALGVPSLPSVPCHLHPPSAPASSHRGPAGSTHSSTRGLRPPEQLEMAGAKVT